MSRRFTNHKPDFDKANPSEVTRVESFEPDYKTACISCEADPAEQPTVTAWKHGRMIHHTHLCGPCCWGEAAMLDPRAWNE